MSIGRRLRRLSPIYQAGNLPAQAGRMGMDAMPIAAKLGDQMVDANAPMISELGTQAATAALPGLSSMLGQLGTSAASGALSAIPGAGAVLAPMAQGAGTLLTTMGPALVQAAGKAAPMAAKALGRGTMAGAAGMAQGLGNLMQGGGSATQDGQNFRAMMASMPSDTSFGEGGAPAGPRLPGADGAIQSAPRPADLSDSGMPLKETPFDRPPGGIAATPTPRPGAGAPPPTRPPEFNLDMSAEPFTGPASSFRQNGQGDTRLAMPGDFNRDRPIEPTLSPLDFMIPSRAVGAVGSRAARGAGAPPARGMLGPATRGMSKPSSRSGEVIEDVVGELVEPEALIPYAGGMMRRRR